MLLVLVVLDVIVCAFVLFVGLCSLIILCRLSFVDCSVLFVVCRLLLVVGRCLLSCAVLLSVG